MRLKQGSAKQTFSVKSQVLIILGFGSYLVSVATLRLCCCGAKAAIDNQFINT